METNILKDKTGKLSSFRILWTLTTTTIVLTWALVSFQTKTLQPWPLDGITTLGLFVSSGIKTYTEK